MVVPFAGNGIPWRIIRFSDDEAVAVSLPFVYQFCAKLAQSIDPVGTRRHILLVQREILSSYGSTLCSQEPHSTVWRVRHPGDKSLLGK